MNNVEYEYKQLITLDEYNNLMQKLHELYACEEFIQINYYYDDKDFSLFHKDETLRVRQKADKLTLERKYNKRYAPGGERICDESSKTIEPLPSKVTIGDNVYFYLGNLVTIRKNYIVDESTVSLDISYYLGKVDYELEVESNKEMILPKVVFQSIKFGNLHNGKYTRFINALKEMRKL